MKKILNEWNKYLNEFKMPDELPADTILSATEVQAQIQRVIDQNANLHASGREIDPAFSENFLNEAELRDILESGFDTQDLKNKLDELKVFTYEMGTSIVDVLEDIYQITFNDANENMTKDVVAYLMNGGAEKLKNSIILLKYNFDIIYEFALMLENSTYYKVLKSVSLFTGSSVEAVRNPQLFDKSKTSKKRGIFGPVRHKNFITKKSSYSFAPFSITSLTDKFVSASGPSPRDFFLTVDAFFNKTFDHIDLYGLERNELTKDLVSSKDILEILSIKQQFSDYQEKLNKISEIGNPIPTQEDYKIANTIVTKLAQLPHKNNEAPYTIFRGMGLNKNVILSLKQLQDKGEEITFNFHTISSWTDSHDIAAGFARQLEGENVPVLFKVYGPKHGTFLDEISSYPEEGEFLTGGQLRITKVEKETWSNYWFVMCEFI